MAESDSLADSAKSVFALPSQTGLLFILIVVAFIGATLVEPFNPTTGWYLSALVSGSLEASALPALALVQFSPSGAISISFPMLVLVLKLLLAPLAIGLSALSLLTKPHLLRRRYRLRPLADIQPSLAARFNSLSRQVGVPEPPELLLSPNQSAGAFVFGAFGKPNVCVTQGLIDRLSEIPTALDAVVAHEMGHVVNGDVTRTEIAEALMKAYFWLWVSIFFVQAAGFVVIRVALGWTDVSLDYGFLASFLYVAVLYVCLNALSRLRQSFADARVVALGREEALTEAIISMSAGPSPRPGGSLAQVRRLAFSTAEAARAGGSLVKRSIRLAGPEPDFWERRAAILEPSEIIKPRFAVSFATGFIVYRLSLALPVEASLQTTIACAAILAISALSLVPDFLRQPAVESFAQTVLRASRTWLPQTVGIGFGIFAAAILVELTQRLAFNMALSSAAFAAVWKNTYNSEPFSVALLVGDAYSRAKIALWCWLALGVALVLLLVVGRFCRRKVGQYVLRWRAPAVSSTSQMLAVVVATAAALTLYAWSAAPTVGSAWYQSLAYLYAGRGDVAQALAQASRATEVDPRSFSAWFFLGLYQGGRGSQQPAESAIASFTRVIALNPRSALAFAFRGQGYSTVRDFGKALDDLEVAVSLNPLDAWVYGIRGTVYDRMGEHQKAIDDYDKAISLGPTLAVGFRARGNAYESLGEHQKAIADISTAISLNPEDAVAYITRGRAYESLGEHQKAIQDTSIGISLNPKDASAYGARGNIYQIMGEYGKAVADYDKSISLNPKDSSVYAARCSSFYRLQEYQRAITDCSTAISLDPTAASYYRSRGNAYEDMGEYQNAIDDYDEAISLNPKDTYPYVNRGDIYQRMGERQKAVDDYSTAISLSPRDASVYGRRGDVHQSMGEYQKAVDDYSTAMSLGPPFAFAYVRRRNAYQSMGEYQKAVADYDRAISLNPEDALPYKSRAFSFRMLGEYTRAIADYSTAISLNPSDAYAYASRGNFYQSMGEHQKAVADYDRAISLDPRDSSAYITRCFSFDRLREHQKAIADCSTAISLGPTAFAYLTRGNVYQGMGDYQKAISDYSAAMSLNPTYSSPYGSRGLVYQSMGEHQKALEDFDTLVSLVPTDAPAHVYRGNAYLSLGRFKESVDDFQKAVSLDSRSAYAYQGLGRVYYLTGDLDSSIQASTRAIEIDPSPAYVHYNLAIALLAKGEEEGAVAEYTKAIAATVSPANIDAAIGDLRSLMATRPGVFRSAERLLRILQDARAAKTR